ncbi:MAG: RING finger protein [Candidatus Heimdallarchaeota archaeon]
MATSVTRLPRLSRMKTTGNFLIFLALGFYIVLLATSFDPTIPNENNEFILLSIGFICLAFAFVTDRILRRPFFHTISGYFSELHDRRLDTQQIALQIDQIGSLQPLGTLNSTLKEIDALHSEISDIHQKTTEEIKSSKNLIKKQDIHEELDLLLGMARDSMREIEKKRENLLFLARTRKIMLDTVRKHLSKPKNEIEADYLLFKTRKAISDHDIDEVLLTRILESVLDGGEIQGQVRISEGGEQVLTVDRLGHEFANTDSIRLTWTFEEENQSETQFCVICRAVILVEEASTSCPMCLNQFHRAHLLEWLKVFNQCPMCHERLVL